MSLLTLLQSGGAVVISGNGIVYYRQFWELDMQFLRQSTASQEVLLGPFVSDTDFKTPQTGLTILNTDILLWKSGATSEASKNSGGATHISSGRYYAVLDATDTDTVGMLEINVVESGALPVKSKYYVLTQSVYDSLFGSASTGPLKPTVDNRTLDITATGAAGIDWDNVENQSAMVSLSNTNIQLCTDVDNVGFVNVLNAGAITSSSINPGALNGKGDWNIGKTGYALTAGTGLGNQTANITGNLSGSVGSVTNAVTVGTINANTITAASIAASALNGKGDWNIGKTGYALSSTGLNLITAWTVNLTGNVSGSVGSVTSPVTVGTNNDKTGYSLTQAFPPNFSSMIITSGGYVIVGGDSFGNTLIIPNLATQTTALAIKAKSDLIPSDIGSVLVSTNVNQREVAVTGSHHVAADIHEFQPGVITALDFDATSLAAIAARVADEPLTTHTTANTVGKVLSDAGSGISTLLSRITSSVATMFSDLIIMIQGSGIAPKWSANALSLAPTSTGSVTATVAVPQVLAHTAYNQDEVIVYRGTFWSFQIYNLGDLTNIDKIWFTLRKRQNDTDSKSMIQIEQIAGLLIANGSPAVDYTQGSLTVDGSTITIQVNQEVTKYCEVTNNLNYDIKALTTGGQVRMLTISDKFIIENDVTRRTS